MIAKQKLAVKVVLRLLCACYSTLNSAATRKMNRQTHEKVNQFVIQRS